MSQIVIIGGGIAGSITALELVKKGHEVIIFEQNDDILQGTSARTPGRMGLGYHYFDSNTAKKYMKQTIEFMRHYPDCFIGDQSTPYLMDGRYIIVKDSLIPLQELMSSYDEITAEFEKICREDKDNDIFGTTHLHKTLKTSEFKEDINCDKAALVIQTKERLLDWKKFSEKLKSEISKNSKVKIIKNSKVKNIFHEKSGKFIVNTEKNSEISDFVINCSWQNIEFLNEGLGIGDSRSKRDDAKTSVTSRLKLLAEVELPESLKNKHSMFFCIGDHAMFSNLGNGIGRITYAPVTNHKDTTDSKMPEEFERWLSKGLNKEESEEFGKKIIEGVSQYIPAMKDAKLIKILPGIVKSKGKVDLKDKDSPFHKRDYSGVEEQQIGWIDNAAMKLFCCLGNAKEVAEILEKQELAKTVIKNIIDFTGFKGDWEELKTDSKIIGQALTNHLQRNFHAEDLTDKKNSESIKKSINIQVGVRDSVLKEVRKGIILRDVKKLLENEKAKEK